MARMPSTRPDDYDRILGQLVCDRLGLNPHNIARDGFTHDRISEKTVMIKATVVMTLPAADMVELMTIAAARLAAQEPRG
jgi:hypothetical protein